ncbi:neprosin family prolyl endopeptidase [Actinoplanes sp. NPDC051851]|uniref:neprosin family prolyl endopeptidase n=1 Tax=Actinoplanes sp. NPDC051851 TaxID=3154753 RepID=UPI0034324F05
MSPQRRRAILAGLTVVAIGTAGLFSSRLGAHAEIVPAPGDVAASVAAVLPPSMVPDQPDAELSPPPHLPWGQPPQEIETGPEGASSGALKAGGLDAAVPDEDQAGNDYAPKGRSSRGGVLPSAVTAIVPPKPPTVVDRAASASNVYFSYNVGTQIAATDGAYGNFTIAKPVLDSGDYHTLAELAVQSSDSRQIVEVGWNVDRVVNGDDDPHLFVYHWVNGVSTCYNGCGFVQYSSNIHPGDTLPRDTAKRIGIQYDGSAWWIAYDTEWVGYYPASRWNGTFTRTGVVQTFGEVAASSTDPCTEMGNGRHGESDTAAAKVGSITYLNGPTVDMTVRTTSDYYDVAKLSGRTFRYGGAGAC